MSRVQKGWLIGGILGLIVLGLVVGAVRPYKHALGAQPSTPPDVGVVDVHREDVPIYGEWIGTLHLLLADLLWIAMVLFAAAALEPDAARVPIVEPRLDHRPIPA